MKFVFYLLPVGTTNHKFNLDEELIQIFKIQVIILFEYSTPEFKFLLHFGFMNSNLNK